MNTFFEEKSSRNVCRFKKNRYLCIAFERDANMVDVVQLVRASDCGSECRRFESGLPPRLSEQRPEEKGRATAPQSEVDFRTGKPEILPRWRNW